MKTKSITKKTPGKTRSTMGGGPEAWTGRRQFCLLLLLLMAALAVPAKADPLAVKKFYWFVYAYDANDNIHIAEVHAYKHKSTDDSLYEKTIEMHFKKHLIKRGVKFNHHHDAWARSESSRSDAEAERRKKIKRYKDSMFPKKVTVYYVKNYSYPSVK